MALGAEASFVARSLDNDRQHLTEVLRQAGAHPGTAFVEIYQNCNVFNDGAFDLLRDRESGKRNQIRLEHGQPIVFDDDQSCVYVGENGRLAIGDTSDVDAGRIVTHDVHGDPSLAFSLAHLANGPTQPTCIGVFHEERRPVYGQAMQSQIQTAVERLGPGDLDKLLRGGDTWRVN